LEKRILIVDDESSVREALELILGRVYSVTSSASGEAALASLATDANVDLVLLDLMMPGTDGIAVLQKLKEAHPNLPVIMLTASSQVNSAVEAMKYGAVDYLNKPYDVDDLLGRIEETLDQKREITHRFDRPELQALPGDFGTLVGKSSQMKELFNQVEQIAPRDITVLLLGESGTGKELVAKEIHERSQRKSGPFVAINCAAIPESQVESELFGHLAGTVSQVERVGLFELANGGTLFLDEVGELNPAVQSRILRFLTSHEFFKLGSSTPTKVSVRVIAATNHDIEAAVNEGSFRKDLFYRLNVVSLLCPPLKSRASDITVLFEYFSKRFSSIYSREVKLSDDAQIVLERYQWPGNVRELENLVESLLALSSKEIVEIQDLPERIRKEAGGDIRGDVLSGNIGFEAAERVFETELIIKALERCNWVQTKTAEMLGISRRILKYKMDKLGIVEKSRD
jgi:DNA-binding NtrC family response regulator